MSIYSDKLRDPRWQKKRLEILERDNWTCLNCKATDKQLQVHHGYYERGLDPWEYPNETLHTYCDDCHDTISKLHAAMSKQLGELSFLEYSTFYGFVLTANTGDKKTRLGFLLKVYNVIYELMCPKQPEVTK